MPDELSTRRPQTDAATEGAIKRWRSSLAVTPHDKRDELEDHLRASLPELIGLGLSPADAVAVAAARLQAATVQEETAAALHLNTVRHPVLRACLDVLLCVAAGIGCLFAVMFTLYLLAWEGITTPGLLAILTIGGVISAVLFTVVFLAGRDVKRITVGAPISTP